MKARLITISSYAVLSVLMSACSISAHEVGGGEPAVGDSNSASIPSFVSTSKGEVHSTSRTPVASSNIGAKKPSSPAETSAVAVAMRAPKAQIKNLPNPNLLLTPEVKREMSLLLSQDRSYLEQSLREREKYYTSFQEIFRDHGVPEELLNLAIVESAYATSAQSPAGAVGIWQFMKSTAKIYGLNVAHKKDERRDPIRSTIAAAQHLRDLYDAFGDWFLALAAYNAGSGAINRGMEKTGSEDFWTLMRRGHLNSETSRFVPKFIAISLILRDLPKYGFTQMASLSGNTKTIG